MVQVIVESGGRAGERIEITRELVLGREGDLRFDDPESSRRHVAIRPTDGGLEVEDLGSTNGTTINGRAVVGRTTASPGDIVRFGTTVLRVAVLPSDADAAHARPIPDPLANHGAVPFSPSTDRRRSRTVSTRSLFATILTVAIIIGTAFAIALYFGMR